MSATPKLRRAEKITPRWPSRVDSRPRFDALLSAIEALLETHSPSEISVQMIAERAGSPVASVYHFFPSSDAALFALAKVYLDEFTVVAGGPLPDFAYVSWQAASRERAMLGRGLYLGKRARMRLLLGPDVPRDVQTLDAESNLALGRALAADLRAHFLISEFDGFEGVVANAVEINDAFWRLSYCRFETITDAMFEEGVRAVNAYLRTYLPEMLQRRPTPTIPDFAAGPRGRPTRKIAKPPKS